MAKCFFRKLKGLMYETDTVQADFARLLKRSESYIGLRMSARASFALDDVYKLCDYFNIPYDQIPEYFPPNGKKSTTKEKTS